MGSSLKRASKKEEETKEEFGKTAADEEEKLSQEDEDMLVKNTRDAAFRILMQLEKRRARAEKVWPLHRPSEPGTPAGDAFADASASQVFVENDKRAKTALNEAKEKYKAEEKVEEHWNEDRGDRIDSWRDFQAVGKKMGIKKPKPFVTEQGAPASPLLGASAQPVC